MTALMIAATISFVTVDPGHFHASLVQKRSYAEVSPEVRVFAPEGAELDAHLKLVDSFNSRAENPTCWKENVYRGSDYFSKFVSAAKAGELGENPIVILAGKNDLKGDYVLAAVEAGVNVLSDKPMAITPEVYAKTEKAARLAEKKGLYFADIMTSHYDLTTALQRELTMDRDLYGEQEKGTPENPAITKESVHHFFKLVNGEPLKRPAWYYDTRVQGEGIVDVTTHLVDQVQWEAFPNAKLTKDDVEMLTARTWPTMISPAQYKMSTGATTDKTLAVEANGEFTYRLKGVCCKISVIWNFVAPKGSGDTHYSVMRGTKAEVFIRQGAKEGFVPVLYVRGRGETADRTEKALVGALAKIAVRHPGVGCEKTDEEGVWKITYPPSAVVTHEAQFGMVVQQYLDWMKAGKQEPNYIDNMLVKYYTLVEAWKKAHNK